jgi:hypothetical protein
MYILNDMGKVKLAMEKLKKEIKDKCEELEGKDRSDSSIKSEVFFSPELDRSFNESFLRHLNLLPQFSSFYNLFVKYLSLSKKYDSKDKWTYRLTERFDELKVKVSQFKTNMTSTGC